MATYGDFTCIPSINVVSGIETGPTIHALHATESKRNLNTFFMYVIHSHTPCLGVCECLQLLIKQLGTRNDHC